MTQFENPMREHEGGKESERWKAYAKKFVLGCVGTIMAINAAEAGRVIDHKATPRPVSPPELSMIKTTQLTQEQRAYYEAQRKEVRELIGQSQTIWDIKQFLAGAAELFGGVLVDDNGDHVPVKAVLDAIQTADEDLYDAVEHMDSLDDVQKMQLSLPEALKNFSAITEHMAQLMRQEAQYAFMFTHNVDFGKGADAGIRSSVQKENIFGYDLMIHTINPEVVGHASPEEHDPKLIIQGFATTSETFKRMAVDLAMRGAQVSVVDLLQMDIDMRGKDAPFSELPLLPQAYAIAAQKGLELVSEQGQKEVDLVGYSMGSLGAAYAAAEQPDRIDTLTLINPVGLYQTSMPAWVRGVRLISDVTRIHSKQVVAESQKSVRAQRVHEDIVGDVQKRMQEQTFRNPFNSVNVYKMGSSFEATASRLTPALEKIGRENDVTLIAASDDVFSPRSEAETQLRNVPAKLRVARDWSHSTMKYKQGEIAYMVNSVIVQQGNHK